MPNLLASGVSIRLLESVALIWKRTRSSNSRQVCGVRTAVQHEKAGRKRLRNQRRILRGQANQGGGEDAARRFAILADDQEVVATLRPENRGGRVLDRHRFSEPGISFRRRRV